MKNSITYVYCVFLAVCLYGCGFGKILKRNSTRSTEHRNAVRQTTVHKDESIFGERCFIFMDSSRHTYQVLIFPRDSFSYTVHDGFRGQAQRIEITGLTDRLMNGKFHEEHLEKRVSDSRESNSERSRIAGRSVSKDVTRRSAVAFIVLLVFAGAVIIGWYWWKFR